MVSLRWFVLLLITLSVISTQLLFPTPIIALKSGDDRLTSDYFLPAVGCESHYTSFYNDKERFDFITTWEQTGSGSYKQTHNNRDGSQDYSLYQIDGDAVLGLESGFTLPQSAGNTERILTGENVVLQNQAVGGVWSGRYSTIDSYENMTAYTCSYQYLGLEESTVIDQTLPAAKISWNKECVKLQGPAYSDWAPLPYRSSGVDWYVQGLGLVKREFSIERPGEETLSLTVLLTKITESPAP